MGKDTYIIAEAGVNHNGSEVRALELVDIAAKAGADAVKFQLFNPDLLVTKSAPTASYQAKNLNDAEISQRDMLAKLTLPDAAMAKLYTRCKELGIDFLCTPFDMESLDLLIKNTQMPYVKLASGEVTNGPLLLACARTGKPVILSTGMSNLEEIAEALSILSFGYTHASGYPNPADATLSPLKGKVTLLHCVSQYPTPPESANLLAIDLMRETFGLPVGFSDHTLGIDVALAAVSEGAVMIEKHFTYDKKAQGPDHAASLDATELAAMIAGIRTGKSPARNPAWLGKREKRCQEVELNTRAVARRSVVAARPIAKGATFLEEGLICKRPADGGITPNKLWGLLGKRAKRDYAADDFINPDELA